MLKNFLSTPATLVATHTACRLRGGLSKIVLVRQCLRQSDKIRYIILLTMVRGGHVHGDSRMRDLLLEHWATLGPELDAATNWKMQIVSMFANIADFKHLTQELDPLPVEALLVVVVVHGLLIHRVPLILK